MFLFDLSRRIYKNQQGKYHTMDQQRPADSNEMPHDDKNPDLPIQIEQEGYPEENMQFNPGFMQNEEMIGRIRQNSPEADNLILLHDRFTGHETLGCEPVFDDVPMNTLNVNEQYRFPGQPYEDRGDISNVVPTIQDELQFDGQQYADMAFDKQKSQMRPELMPEEYEVEEENICADPEELEQAAAMAAEQYFISEEDIVRDGVKNDARFFSLDEIAERETCLEMQTQIYGAPQSPPVPASGSESDSGNSHVLLTPHQYRAKLYYLNGDGKWLDVGTGYFRVLQDREESEYYMQIVSEENMAHDEGQQQEGENEEKKDTNASELETTHKVLYRDFIMRQQEFQRQRETIITWKDEQKKDFALSFQDKLGARNTWFSICFLKGLQVSATNNDDQADGSETNNQDNSEDIQEVIPFPTDENLSEIVQELVDRDFYARRRIAETVLQSSTRQSERSSEERNYVISVDDNSSVTQKTPWLDKLQEIFIAAENGYKLSQQKKDRNLFQASVRNLHSLFQIYRNLIALSNKDIIELLMQAPYWLTTFGALEYDPEVFLPMGDQYNEPSFDYESEARGGSSPIMDQFSQNNYGGAASVKTPARDHDFGSMHGEVDSDSNTNMFRQRAQPAENNGSFREFLETRVKFREAVDINKPKVLASIHLTYRLQYLKDTAMARFIDDQTGHTVNQIIIANQQLILEYLFGEDFDRIQEALLKKMQSENQDLAERENALRFFTEMCQLLKFVQMNHRPYPNTKDLSKIVVVLAETFNIMVPNYKTLCAEMEGDFDQLVSIYEARVNDGQQPKTPPQLEQQDSRAAPDLFDRCDEIQPTFQINPPTSVLKEYLRCPSPEDDPYITKVDAFKSNSIEVLSNLQIVLSRVDMRLFIQSVPQLQRGYPFLQNLAAHMVYSSQMGVKISICEFLKDLLGQDIAIGLRESIALTGEDIPGQSTNKVGIQKIVLENVVMQLLDFIESDQSPPANTEEKKVSPEADRPRKILTKLEKAMEQSRCLVLQFINKLITEGMDPYNLRVFLVRNKVIQKVAALQRFQSVQTNVEIVKFFKAIVLEKDQLTLDYIFKKEVLLDCVMEMFMNNPRKGNMLHSCILALFDTMATPSQLVPKTFGTLVEHLKKKNYVETVFYAENYKGDFLRFNSELSSALEKADERASKKSEERSHSRQRSQSRPKYVPPHMRSAEDQLCIAAGIEPDCTVFDKCVEENNFFPSEEDDDDSKYLEKEQQPALADVKEEKLEEEKNEDDEDEKFNQEAYNNYISAGGDKAKGIEDALFRKIDAGVGKTSPGSAQHKNAAFLFFDKDQKPVEKRVRSSSPEIKINFFHVLAPESGNEVAAIKMRAMNNNPRRMSQELDEGAAQDSQKDSLRPRDRPQRMRSSSPFKKSHNNSPSMAAIRGEQRFINSEDGEDGSLKEHYDYEVDFVTPRPCKTMTMSDDQAPDSEVIDSIVKKVVTVSPSPEPFRQSTTFKDMNDREDSDDDGSDDDNRVSKRINALQKLQQETLSRQPTLGRRDRIEVESPDIPLRRMPSSIGEPVQEFEQKQQEKEEPEIFQLLEDEQKDAQVEGPSAKRPKYQ